MHINIKDNNIIPDIARKNFGGKFCDGYGVKYLEGTIEV